MILTVKVAGLKHVIIQAEQKRGDCVFEVMDNGWFRFPGSGLALR